jgi:AhpD family alkylhydroperoxidase
MARRHSLGGNRARALGRASCPGMFTIHTEATAPALAAIRERIGFVPNLAAVLASSPTALACFGTLQDGLRGSTLSPLEREVAGLAVSFENDCAYSMAAHSTFAVGAGAARDLLSALRAGEPIDDPRLEAVRRFAVALVRDHGHGRDAFGLSAEEQLEVAAQVVYTTLANLVANLADPPLDEPFAAQRWDLRATLGASG